MRWCADDRPLRGALCGAAAWLLLAAVPAVPSAWLHPRHPDWSLRRPPALTAAGALALAAPVQWVDARDAAAFAAGHMPGAVNVSEDAWDAGLEALLQAWTPGTLLVVYCDSSACSSSRAVAERLRRDLGLKAGDLRILKGGWEALKEGAR